MGSARARVGFEKERSCVSKEPLALTPEVFSHNHWHSRCGILSVGLGILHFTG